MTHIFIFLIALFIVMVSLAVFARSVAVRLSGWMKAYQLLAKRYGSNVRFSNARPWIKFNYSGSVCVLKNICSSLGNDRMTQLRMVWPDRRLKLFISTLGVPSGAIASRKLKPLPFEPTEFNQETDQPIRIFTNKPIVSLKLLTPSTQWKIQQLIQNAGKSGVEIYVNRGYLSVFKPGYIKNTVTLDDFVRFGLELFDQFKMALNEEIEFMPDDGVVVLDGVTCPICSENLHYEIVTCVRCRTPHCADCWEYNGQCATFACNETRNLRSERPVKPVEKTKP